MVIDTPQHFHRSSNDSDMRHSNVDALINPLMVLSSGAQGGAVRVFEALVLVVTTWRNFRGADF